MRSRLAFAAAIWSQIVLAAPGLPTPTSPADGGWCARTCNLNWHFAQVLQTVGTEVQVFDDQGGLVGSTFDTLTAPPDDNWTTPNLADAGFFTWQVRGRDDAGVTSSWSAAWLFKLDGDAPPAPATVTDSLDGGWLRLVSAPLSDSQSGLAVYHFGFSQIDRLDGGLTFNTSFFTQKQSGPSRDTWLGPGTWLAGVHGHDKVDNAGITTLAGPFVVPTSATLPQAPQVVLARSDGGAWPNLPYISSGRTWVITDAGGAAVTQWTFSRRPANTDAGWALAGFGGGASFNQLDLPTGPLELRVALISGTEVSAWSAPIVFHVDQNAPLSLSVSASVDGGVVTLSWPYGRDVSTGASGINHYEVRRLHLDASVVLPDVPHQQAPITTTDVPGEGAWSFSVASVDNAGNRGSAAVVTVDLPPAQPTGFRALATSSLPVDLSWDDARDGGFDLTWKVTRVDAFDASVPVGTALTPALIDDAPEGRWSYELVATVDGLNGPAARLDGVVRDLTPPAVSVPLLNRVGARTVELTWSASDALSGLMSVMAERDDDGGVVSLGAQSSPFVDGPVGDGTFHYRVVATDVAGNLTTSGWSAGFLSPVGVSVDPLEPAQVSCGQRLAQAFTASEPVTWTLLDGPEGATLDGEGVFTWEPTAQHAGEVTVRVGASGVSGSGEGTWRLDVTCESRRATVGCGCGSLEGSVLLLALSLLRRKRSVPRSASSR